MKEFLSTDFFIAVFLPLAFILPALYLTWRVLESHGMPASPPQAKSSSTMPSGPGTIMDMGS